VIAERLGIDIARLAGSDAFSRDEQLSVYEAAAEAAMLEGNWPEVQRRSRHGLKIASGGRRIHLLGLLARATANLREYDDALAIAERGLREAEAPRDAMAIVRFLTARGHCYMRAGRLTEAVTAGETAVDVLQRHSITDPYFVANVYMGLASWYQRAGRPREAHAAYETSLEAAARFDSILMSANAHTGVAAAAYHSGDLRAALRHFGKARELFARVADAERELSVLRSLAEVNIEVSDLDEAARLARRVEERGKEVGDQWNAALGQRVLAEVQLLRGNLAEAMRIATEAEKTIAEQRSLPWRWSPAVGRGQRHHFPRRDPNEMATQHADALRTIGAIHHANKEWARSDRAYARALEISAEFNRTFWMRTAKEYADRLSRRGLAKRAYALLAEATAAPGVVTAEKRRRSRGRRSS
jgi:tetratricopeptide (TPR) repeat protein